MSRSVGGGGSYESRVKPITPDDVKIIKKTQIPDVVIAVFNTLIVKNMTLNGSSTIKQDAIVKEICARMVDDTHTINEVCNRIFNEHWLDVEEIYRNAGWIVEYDKPAYCESYESYFIFRKEK
jgi:hypothetical protein